MSWMCLQNFVLFFNLPTDWLTFVQCYVLVLASYLNSTHFFILIIPLQPDNMGFDISNQSPEFTFEISKVYVIRLQRCRDFTTNFPHFGSINIEWILPARCWGSRFIIGNISSFFLISFTSPYTIPTQGTSVRILK